MPPHRLWEVNIPPLHYLQAPQVTYLDQWNPSGPEGRGGFNLWQNLACAGGFFSEGCWSQGNEKTSSSDPNSPEVQSRATLAKPQICEW